MATSKTAEKKRKAAAATARPNKLHVKKGDRVIVITGKDRGVTGRIIETYPRTERVLVEGVNRIKKHTKVSSTQRGAKTGGIVTQEASIHVSNVMLAVEVEGKTMGTRVGYRFDGDGKKVRIAKRTGEDI